MQEISRPFVILALPRSRTAWLSEFLSYGGMTCAHDLAPECASISEFMTRLAAYDGTVETGAVVGWRLIRRYIPQAQIIVVKRQVAEVKASLRAVGLTPIPGEIEARGRLLDECAAALGVLSFTYDQLDDPEICRRIFETCCGFWLDRAWYDRCANRNVQVDVPIQVARLIANRDRIAAFKAEVARELEAEICSV